MKSALIGMLIGFLGTAIVMHAIGNLYSLSEKINVKPLMVMR